MYMILLDSPKVPLVLLVYAMETVVTTAACIAEYLSWKNITFQEKVDLMTLYGPYLAIGELLSSGPWRVLMSLLWGSGFHGCGYDCEAERYD
jgi:hypothetical protein